jgi:hypothetical protein
MFLLLPDVDPDINELKKSQNRWKVFAGIGGGVSILIIIAIVILFSLSSATPETATDIAGITDTPTPVSADTPTSLPATTELPSPPTQELTTEPTIEETQTPTEEATPVLADQPTSIPIGEVSSPLTEEPTQEPAATPIPTPLEKPATGSILETLSGKIAVPVFENGMYNTYLASADNNWTPELLFEQASQPAFAGNGRGMVIHSWKGADWGKQLIYLTDFEDLINIRKMTNFIEDAHPNFNKHGDEVVFHSRQESRDRDPIIIRLNTSPGSPLVKLGEGTNPDWLGDNIVYYKAFPNSGIYLMSKDGESSNEPIILTSKTVPAASPDEDHVALPLHDGKNWQINIFSVNQGPGSLMQLTAASDADNILPVWSPDGNHIAFASKRDGDWAIWVMNVDGSSQEKLFDLPGSVDGTISDPDVEPTLTFGWFEERMSWAP